MTEEDHGFARGNAWARALRGRAIRTPLRVVAKLLLSLVVSGILVAALVLPILFTHGLIVGGVRLKRPEMIAIGVLFVLLYGYTAARLLRKRGTRQPPTGAGS